MDLAGYWVVIRKYWRSVVGAFAAGLLLAGGVSALTRPTYTASSSVYVSVQASDTAGELAQGSTYAENQVKSFARIATTPIVLDPVISQLRLPTAADELAKAISVSVPASTAIIEINVVGGDPKLTAAIANAVAVRLVAAVGELAPATGKSDSAPVVATVVAPAVVPTQWSSPRVPLNLALGCLAGLLLGVGQALLRDRYDTRIVSEADVAEVTESPVLGAVGFDDGYAGGLLTPLDDRFSAQAEAFRRIRTNLQFLAGPGLRRAFVLTSSIAGEGKSTTAINLATTLADAGESVLLVEADLRSPKAGEYLGLESAAGLSTVLIGQASLPDVVKQVGDTSLSVLAAGKLPPNPAELLASDAMRVLLDEACAAYGTVILDSPPLLPVTDAAVLAELATGAIVLVGSGEVRQPALAEALRALELARGRLLGVVLNKVKGAGDRYDAYRYYRGEYRPRGDAETLVAESAGAEW